MRVSAYNTAEVERELGKPSGQCHCRYRCHSSHSLDVNSANRDKVRAWLLSQGYPSAWVQSARTGTLGKAYNRPAYLRWCDNNRDKLGRGDLLATADEPSFEGEPPTPAPIAPIALQPSAPGTVESAIQALIAASTGKLDEARVRELIAEHVASPEPIYRDRIVIMKDGQEDTILDDSPRHAVFADVLAAAVAGLNVLLVGPAGCGKTQLAEQVAKARGRRFGHTGAVASKYDISGYRDATGQYVSNCEFPDFYENGGDYLFDEIDGSVPNALLFMNTALANGQCAFPHRTAKKHADFFCIAAANTFGNGANLLYVGRNPLDAASKDRFVIIDMDYDEALERAIYGDTDWTAFVQKVRKAVATLGLRHVVSMRATAQGKALLEAGMSRDKVERYTLWKGLEADQIAKVRHAMGNA